MTLLIDNRQTLIEDDLQLFFEKAIQATLKQLELNLEVEVSLLLVDNEEIRQLNRDYRSKDQATDVLSFPMIELDPLDRPSYLEALEENLDQNDVLLLGDIVISVERAIEQAKDYGHNTQRELGFLMVHGMLHLLGYDHEIDEESEAIMNALQESILLSLNLPRS